MYKKRMYLRTAGIIVLLSTAVAVFLTACSPKIYSFEVSPMNIGEKDSVMMKWDVKGTPAVLNYYVPAEDETPALRVYKLVVQRNGKEINREAQVAVWPDEFTDAITFNTYRSGDTLIAAGEKNTITWGNKFKIKTLASASRRSLQVTHAGVAAELDADGKTSLRMNGMVLAGAWEIRSLLSTEEKRDSSLIPSRLSIRAVIVH